MEIRVLGAHNQETRDARMVSILVDGLLALDAGGLTSTLTLEEQENLQALLLTHRHYDHVRDLPILALATLDVGATLPVYGLADTLAHLQSHLLDGAIYPNFTLLPSPERPRLRLVPLETHQSVTILGYQVQAIPMAHTVPAAGFQVTSPRGKRLFYTGDTGGFVAKAIATTSPDLLLVEVTVPNRMADHAQRVAHLTPAALHRELEEATREGTGLPPVVALHITPSLEEEIRRELKEVATALGAQISVAFEGATFRL